MDKVAAYLLKKNLISEELAPWLTYALYRFVLSAVSYTILFTLGWLFAGPAAAFVFLVSYTVLRRYIGGYHANSPVLCIIISASAEAVVLLLLLPFFAKAAIMSSIILSITALISVMALAPLPPKNLHETAEERLALKKFSRIFAVVEFAVCMLFLLLNLPLISLYISMGMFCAAFTLWIEKLKTKEHA